MSKNPPRPSFRQGPMFTNRFKLFIFAAACTLVGQQYAFSTAPVIVLDTKDVELCDATGDIVTVSESDIEGPTIFLFQKTADSYLFWTLSDAQRLVSQILTHDDLRMRLEDLTTMSHYIMSLGRPPAKDPLASPHEKMINLFGRFLVAPHDLSTLSLRWSIALPKLTADLAHVSTETVADWVANQIDIAIIDTTTSDVLVNGSQTPEQHAAILRTRKDGTTIFPFLYVNTAAQHIKRTQTPLPHKAPPKKNPIAPAKPSGFGVLKIFGTVIVIFALIKQLSPKADTPPDTGSASSSGTGSASSSGGTTTFANPTGQVNKQAAALQKFLINKRRKTMQSCFNKWRSPAPAEPTPPATPPQPARTTGPSHSDRRRDSVRQPSASTKTGAHARRHSWPSVGEEAQPREPQGLVLTVNTAGSTVVSNADSDDETPAPTAGHAVEKEILTSPSRLPSNRQRSMDKDRHTHGKLKERSSESASDSPLPSDHPVNTGSNSELSSPQRSHAALKGRPIGDPFSIRRARRPQGSLPTVLPKKHTAKSPKATRKKSTATHRATAPTADPLGSPAKTSEDEHNMGFTTETTSDHEEEELLTQKKPRRNETAPASAPAKMHTTLIKHSSAPQTPQQARRIPGTAPHTAPQQHFKSLYFADEYQLTYKLMLQRQALNRNKLTYPYSRRIGDTFFTQRSESASPDFDTPYGSEELQKTLDSILKDWEPDPLFVAAYFIYQPTAGESLFYFSWQDYLALVDYAKKNYRDDIIDFLSAVNNVLFNAKKPLSPAQLLLARILTGGSFGRTKLPREDMCGITPSLTEYFSKIGIHRTKCVDEVRYFKVLDVFPDENPLA